MTDHIKELVERLRGYSGRGWDRQYIRPEPHCEKAADLILSLSSEVERMRGAIEQLKNCQNWPLRKSIASAALGKDTPNDK